LYICSGSTEAKRAGLGTYLVNRPRTSEHRSREQFTQEPHCPDPVPYRTEAASSRLRPATSSISLDGPGEAEADGVGEGDGEAVGDAVGVPVVVGPVEGAGVVVAGAVFSGRAGGSYGPLSAADNAAAITTEASKHAGASTITSGTRTNGRTHPSKTYHNNAANTTTTAADSHHGYPRINALLCPPIRHPHRTRPRGSARSD
jgi:hypothetical protein